MLRLSVVILFACLVGPAHAIVGASEPGDAYASRVVMVLARGRGTSGFCSGVVVAPRVVLTAAHCVAGTDDTRIFIKDPSGAPLVLSVSAIARHGAYRADAIASRARSIDLALVRVAVALPPSFIPTPVALDGDATVGATLRLAGFGQTNERDANAVGVLRSARLVVRAPASQVLIWASGANGTGACAGDSGAPLFDAQDRLVGIADWAAGDGNRRCGALTQGARLAPQAGWIADTVRGWGE